MDSGNNDLGLDQPLKLGRVSRIAKITDELLFENNRGLPQVRKKYKNLLRALRKNDQASAKRIRKEHLSISSAHELKVSTEVENLQKVLLFYQLWCHGLFPKATFQDCLKILRAHKSIAIREYRRGLIENEIRRLKIEKGIIVEDPGNGEPGESDEDLYIPSNNGVGISPGEKQNMESQSKHAKNVAAESDDDDWGILSTRRSRNGGLFIEDEDDDSTTSTNPTSAHIQSEGLPQHEDYPDEADYEDFTGPQHDEHDEELSIMRDMGM